MMSERKYTFYLLFSNKKIRKNEKRRCDRMLTLSHRKRQEEEVYHRIVAIQQETKIYFFSSFL